MFNNVNNPFGNRAISSSTSSDSNGRRQKEDPKEELKKYIDEDEPDEVLIGGQPILTEEEVLAMTRQYIAKLKSEHEDNEKVQKKLDKYLENFDVKKFMKKNPNIASDMAKQLSFDLKTKLDDLTADNIKCGKLISKEDIKPVFLRLDSELADKSAKKQ